MNAKFSLDDYIDVAERIQHFVEKYPEGSLQTIGWEIIEVTGTAFIVYRAAAYRTPDDERPGHGIAWEPFPGKTPYTRDSELMNAETAAWGRAIVALGLTANRKIASRQEVKARTGEEAAGPPADTPSDAQLKFLRSLVKKHEPSPTTLNAMLEQVGAGHLAGVVKWTPELSKQQCSALIEIFKEGVLPTGESDIPADLPDTPLDGPPVDEDLPWADELPSKTEAQELLNEARNA
jgi:hypothetical protein